MGYLLCTTGSLINLITGSAGTINAHVSCVSISGTTVTPEYQNTATISTATTTQITPAVASSTYTNVKKITVRNGGASSNVITLQHTDGTNVEPLFSFALQPSYTFSYEEGVDWSLYDSSGGKIQTPLTGRYLGSTLLTSASGNFTTTGSCSTIRIRGVGGGAGGAGCTSLASAAAAGGGGGAGSYIEKTVAVSPNTSYAYTCGPAGAGASGALGGNGTNSTFVVGVTTYTANGGVGAPVATAVTTLISYLGGAGGAVSTNGDVNIAGYPGYPGVTLVVATPIGVSGNGGSSPLGAGGLGINAVGNGNNATGYGAGGSGAFTGASAVRTGGNGSAGCWIVDQYS